MRLCLVIVAIGILLRLVFYFQNRCLFIDEANVARNIFERSFAGLTRPLNYEQYAPPVFLWIIKCFVVLFGYGEYAFRLFPLVCGCTALWLMYRAARRYSATIAIWYPISIMATGFIYIRYSAELKQYMSDAAVTLTLLLLVMRYPITEMRAQRFFVSWASIGSVAIWLSMSSIFVLAGIGAFHVYTGHRAKKHMWPLLACLGAVWLVQFVIYYMVMLRPQIGSGYLQECHKDHFLYLIPHTSHDLAHNMDVLVKVLAAMGGKWAIPVALHIMALIMGVVRLYKRRDASLLLLVLPILLTILAAARHQYALTPRLVLFLMPLLLLIISAGLSELLTSRYLAVRVLVVGAAFFSVYKSSAFQLLYTRMDNEEITTSMGFLQRRNIKGDKLYVHDLSRPGYIYYTTIHPDREKWRDMAGAYLLVWNSNYDSLGRAVMGTIGLLYSWASEQEIAEEQEALRRHCEVVADTVVTGSRAYVYRK